MMKQELLPLIIVLSVFIISCNSTTRLHPSSTPPDALVIVFHSPLTSSGKMPEPLHFGVNDVASVQTLYQHLFSLPDIETHGSITWCPADNGEWYDLTFTLKSTIILHASAHVTGCATVALGHGDVRQCDDYVRSTLNEMLISALRTPTPQG